MMRYEAPNTKQHASVDDSIANEIEHKFEVVIRPTDALERKELEDVGEDDAAEDSKMPDEVKK